ncbi:hypothetical protein [Methylobacterium sp. CCH5-D2]|uniref:hypothetical protein n=1 Tax=Methylobacterium sp. CCH5-D2 TaxID=1768765 RepID=UPI0008335028|nr:hypothetical protein [Methylobacterium sp. CCH5-D2]
MVDAAPHVPGQADPQGQPAPAVQRPLTSLEQALLAALTDAFVSTSVLRSRARLIAVGTACRMTVKMLGLNLPLAPISAACDELERRGLAQCEGKTARFVRWRRAERPR